MFRLKNNKTIKDKIAFKGFVTATLEKSYADKK